MVKCDCGMIFLPAFFDGVCPKCKKKYNVTPEEERMKEVATAICDAINMRKVK
jgi:hypothetical protein